MTTSHFQVVQTDPGDGANGGIDSEHEDYTGWYQRTNADGEPVGYDYETGEWADGWTPETTDAEDDGDDELRSHLGEVRGRWPTGIPCDRVMCPVSRPSVPRFDTSGNTSHGTCRIRRAEPGAGRGR